MRGIGSATDELRRMKRQIIGAALAVTFALVAGAASAVQPLAGEEITNQATVTYFNPRIGVTETVHSNTVSIEVLPVPSLEVTGEQELVLSPGAEGQYIFRAENVGNVAIDAKFSMEELTGDDFDVTGDLYLDGNKNGVVDPGERVIGPDDVVPLALGETANLIYRFNTPAGATPDQESLSRLTSTSTPRGANSPADTQVNESSTTIVDSALSLAKSAKYNQAEREIEYRIAVRNNSKSDTQPYSRIGDETILLDGTPKSVVLARDLVPLNTMLVSARAGGAFEPVYHKRGDAEHSYLSSLPESPDEVDAVAFMHEGTYAISRSSDLYFTVSIPEGVTGVDVTNQAEIYSLRGSDVVPTNSNEVVTPIDGPKASIEFRESTGTTPISATPFDRNVVIHLNAANCNATGEIDEILVNVRTERSGDEENIPAYETGPNTGIFQTAPTGILRVDDATPLNNVIEGKPGDSAGAKATAVCLGEPLETSLLVQAGGFVFDSVTNEAVRNAAVAIYQLSSVRDTNPRMLIRVSTDSSGYFDLGEHEDGIYRIQVAPPEHYSFPSVRHTFEGFEREVSSDKSYGVVFTLADGAIVDIDIPIDPGEELPLALEKTADRSEVRRGGYVVYTLKARNTLDQLLQFPRIEDQFPPGFTYVEGSAKQDGEPLAEAPTVANGGLVTFELEDIGPRGETELVYTARVGPTTGEGDRTNVAVLHGTQAGTGNPKSSLTASDTVRVDDRGGVFSDEAVVIGRVFLDKDGNGIQDDEEIEPGVPGVKIVTSTGLAVVTDEHGRYSLFGLRPVTQTFALMRGTLPVDAEPVLLDVDDVRAPGSRLIDLKRGELRDEDFPLEWSAAAEAEVASRVEEFERLDRGASEADDLPLAFDTEHRDSSRNEAGIDTTTEFLRGEKRKDTPSTSGKEADGKLAKKAFNPEEVIKTLTPELGFVGIEDGAFVAHGSTVLGVKSPAEAIVRLEVNGEPVPASQIGAKVIDRDEGIQLYQYVAVRLRPEDNKIVAIISDPFGNDREREEITVYAPGRPTQLEIVAPRYAPANGHARIPIVVRALDSEGRRVGVPAEVTLTSENGTWDVEDIRDSVPGLQAYLDNGEATFDFIPPDLVGGEIISAETGFAVAEAEIGFTPDLTERVFVGVIEGAVGFGEKGAHLEGLMKKDDISVFEETTEGVRGQLYLKGKILGDALLTLRYDSDRDTNERLFRDIQRDEFYPVYGDRSERGFDAQSDGPIYVKVEREQSYLLYGDLAIEPQADAIQLGSYRRSLTGGRAHYEAGSVTVDLFVAEADSDQRLVEVRGRGVSGPYDIDFDHLVDGSEVVEILVRDRDQPNVILSVDRQERFQDYTLDFFRGTLIFNRPIPQIDDDLNPVSIRVTYETEEGEGDEYFVYGGEVRVEPIDGLAFGYREVRSDADRPSDDRRTVRSGYAEADLNQYGKVQVELAQTEDYLGKSGTGQRATYELNTGPTALRAEAARTSEEFDAPNSSVGPGREEVRVTVDHLVNDRLAVGGEALFTRDINSDDRRIGAEVDATYAATPTLDLLAGLRGVDTDRSSGDSEIISAIAGLAWRPTYVPGTTLRAEYEQDFLDGENWRLLLGGDYQYNPDLRFYALNEISTTESGFFGIGDGTDANFTTKVGAEYNFNEAVSGYSEYRDNGGIGADGGAATGLRGKWQINERFSWRAAVEHVEPVNADDTRSSSIALGYSYENDEEGYGLRGDFEWEDDERGDGFYSNLAASYSLDPDFTVLARNRFALDRRGDDRTRDRMRLGLAWRPENDNRLKALGLYEFEYDDEDNGIRETAHRWSIGGDYSPDKDMRLNMRYAGENYTYSGDGFEDSTTLHMLRGGMEFDFSRDRFSLGGNGMIFTDDEGESVTLGAGAEVKVNVIKNAQIAVGYNYVDLDEDRLRDLYHSGFYLRLRLKLDDSLWDEFDRTGFSGHVD